MNSEAIEALFLSKGYDITSSKLRREGSMQPFLFLYFADNGKYQASWSFKEFDSVKTISVSVLSGKKKIFTSIKQLEKTIQQ